MVSTPAAAACTEPMTVQHGKHDRRCRIGAGAAHDVGEKSHGEGDKIAGGRTAGKCGSQAFETAYAAIAQHYKRAIASRAAAVNLGSPRHFSRNVE